jgi:hypothetical protein
MRRMKRGAGKPAPCFYMDGKAIGATSQRISGKATCLAADLFAGLLYRLPKSTTK